MKNIIFFLCLCSGQSFGLIAMEHPQERIRSTMNSELTNAASIDKKEEPRPQSPKAEQVLRKFAQMKRFKYTGEYKVSLPQNPE